MLRAGHTPPDVALEYRQITPIRRTGSLDTSRQRNGPVSGHISGTYPLIPAYQDLGFATTVTDGDDDTASIQFQVSVVAASTGA